MPVGAEAIFDENAFVWLSEYDTRDALPQSSHRDARPRQWLVFDTAGLYQGRVALPGRLRVHAIADDAVAGVWTDADGIESVRVYRIQKPLL